jgi:phosphate transport system substrate-binding protein
MVITTAFRRTVTVSLTTVAISLGSVYTAIAQTVTLNGAGATFPKPLYDRYFDAFKKEANIQVNYEGIGSGGGIRQFIAGTVDFAGSDAYPKASDKEKMSRGVVMVPTAGGAVAVVYNIPGVSNLKLSRSVLPAIFAGDITRWNDAKIAADNRGVNLPNKPIRLAVRSDSSGTTNIFTTHLAAISPAFKSKIEPGSAPTWRANPLSGKGNPGVAALVQQTEGSIGYVEAAYASQNKLQQAQVQNKAGRFVSPTLEEANKALSTISFTSDFNTAGGEDPKDGYPIAGVTWLLIYKQYPDAAKANSVKKMVSWILTKGQEINKELGYTRIPSAVVTRVNQAVNSNVASR